MLRPFERTAGDEFQGVLDDPAALAAVVERLLREDGWNIGIGIGEVEEPLPDEHPSRPRPGLPPRPRGGDRRQVRALAAAGRRRRPRRPCVRRSRPRCGSGQRVLSRRTSRGWEVADLVDAGASYDQAAKRLGVTQSAISQRAQAAGIVEGRRARELVTELARWPARRTRR